MESPVPAQNLRSPPPLPRDPLAFALALLLALVSFDAVARTDLPLWAGAPLFLAATLYRNDSRLVPSALLLFFLFTVERYFPDWFWSIPSATFLVPVLLTLLTCFPIAHFRPVSLRWLRKGDVDQVLWFLVALTCLISALALILWALWADYLGVGSKMLGTLHSPRWFTLLVLVPGFAVVNAAAEEAVFRGVLQEALEEIFPDRLWLVLALQASAFAAVHYQAGFPNGKVGYVMVLAYAGMLGWLRNRSNGMLAPYVAHVSADLVIGVTLVMLAG